MQQLSAIMLGELQNSREVDDVQDYKFTNNLRVTAAEPEEMSGCDS